MDLLARVRAICHAVWCKAPAGVQEEMITADPEQFFRPAWRSRPDWIGVRLDPPSSASPAPNGPCRVSGGVE